MTYRRTAAQSGGVATVLAGAAAAVVAVALLAGAAAAGLASTLGLGDGSGAFRVGTPVPSSASATVALPSTADTFPWGQCTWFAAHHHEITWLGDAADWLRNARLQGVSTSETPSVGAIVVYHRGGSYSWVDGHVALVVAVAPRSYTVAEMNFVAFGRVDERVIEWPDPEVVGFIP